ncbi:PaRep2a protein [Pyrobaculum aerophilum]|uniref:PaRep2a protein n=1 Tax=Pyrobaculum aerophilum TaxID=13773 RepID=UPI0028691AB5|nr:PaRep2a protein [Pyrobaculum aerophilum]
MSEYALGRVSLWEGEWRGKPMSCFAAEKKAVCKVGDKMALSACLTRPWRIPKAGDKANKRVD